jgi:predicted ATP-dependent serine protease
VHMINGKRIWSMNDVPNIPVHRIPTGIKELDLAYGRTEFMSGIEYGLPKGRISYWFGESGVGKSRLTILLTHRMNAVGKRVLVCSGEVPPDQFSQWFSEPLVHPESYFVTDETDPDKICVLIRQYLPDIVVIDSANMLDGFDKRNEVKPMFQLFKDCIAEVSAHCIMIGHLNKDGSLKGATTVPHLVDVIAAIRKYKQDKGCFASDIPGGFHLEVLKNRYGKSGGWVAFRHTAKGVELYVREDGIPAASCYIKIEGEKVSLTPLARKLFPDSAKIWDKVKEMSV